MYPHPRFIYIIFILIPQYIVDKNRLAILLFLVLLNILAAFSQPLSIFVDEGQYLLVSKKMLDGWIPYRDIVENKPLGMYLSLMPAVVLGDGDFVKLRLFGALVVSLTSFLIFLIGEGIKDRKTGLLGAVIFILLEAFPPFSGYNLITEPMANLFIAGFFYVLISSRLDYSSALPLGVLAAAACSIRQTSVLVFIPFAFAFLHSSKLERKKILLLFTAGGLLVGAPILVYLLLSSALGDAIYWCFLVLIRLGGSSLEAKLRTLYVFLLFFFPFVFFAFFTLRDASGKIKIVWLWLLSSFVLIQVGYTHLHNYLFIIPPVSILAAMGIWSGGFKRSRNAVKKAVLEGARIIMFLLIVFVLIIELGSINEVQKDRTVYLAQATMEEEHEVSSFVHSNTNSSEGIFVFRTDAEVYYLSDRKPVTKMTFFFLDYLAMMGNSEMEELILHPLEQHKPRYFVLNAADFEMFGDTRNYVTVKEYLDSRYEPVKRSGPLEVYERKG